MFNKMSLNGISTEDCPCRFCTKETGRSPTCHSTCTDRYIPWKNKHDGKLEEKYKQIQSIDVFYSGAKRRNKSLTTKAIIFGRGKKGKR